MDIRKKQEQLRELAKSLKELSTEELEKREKEVIAKADENDKKVGSTEFDLPKDNYKVVAEAVQYFLNKQTVEWQYTLGLLSIYEFWNPEKYSKKITYPMLDATLRTLGEMKFTGYEEWARVIAINKFLEELRKEYEAVTESIYDIANEHNAILDELKLRKPQEDL
jgi:hypothetical protein